MRKHRISRRTAQRVAGRHFTRSVIISRPCFAILAAGVLCIAQISSLSAAPIPNDELEVTAVMFTGDELGGANSNYNPRHFSNANFVLQINNAGTLRYPVATDEAEAVVSFAEQTEARMFSPMDGGNSTDWLLLAGGVDQGQFSRLPYDAEDGEDREFSGPEDHEPNSFDWVDNDTIIYSSYEYRDQLFLADVSADPFSGHAEHELGTRRHPSPPMQDAFAMFASVTSLARTPTMRRQRSTSTRVSGLSTLLRANQR